MSGIWLLHLRARQVNGCRRSQRLLCRGAVVEEKLDMVAEIVDSVLQISDAAVDLGLPHVEIRLRRLHLRHGALKIRYPLRVLAQQGKDLPELLLLSHHDLLSGEVLVRRQDDNLGSTAAADHTDLGTDLWIPVINATRANHRGEPAIGDYGVGSKLRGGDVALKKSSYIWVELSGSERAPIPDVTTQPSITIT